MRPMTLMDNFYRHRSKMRRNIRMIFPSPAELQFIEIMGGRIIRVRRIRHPHTHFPAAFIVSLGRTLKREGIKREVRVGRHYVDFGVVTEHYKQAIEIDGDEWHRDIVKETQRDEYLQARGWEVLHIRAIKLSIEPDKVRARVYNFFRG